MENQFRGVSPSDVVKPGQVWEVSLSSNPRRWVFVVISRKPFQLKGRWYVRVMPTYPLPCREYVDENTDFLVKPRGRRWGEDLLAEWWNERPVLVANLTRPFGVVPEGVHYRLDWVLRYPERMTDPTAESVKLFRQRERERWDLISADSKQLCC
ncbi:MAG: hypothetical protein EOM59_13655 [Clostridia bacterium]|nr:hypothetical protein [Clostridia bacterium]